MTDENLPQPILAHLEKGLRGHKPANYLTRLPQEASVYPPTASLPSKLIVLNIQLLHPPVVDLSWLSVRPIKKYKIKSVPLAATVSDPLKT